MNAPDRKKCILCIDDDKGMHALLESQLAVNNYASLHAANGNEALQKIRDNRVDLVILDINMPDMDGFQILGRLKKDDATRAIPVIFLSSLSRENLKVKGLEHGADDFIVKPFTGPELIARIKAVLRRNEPLPMAQPSRCDVQGNVEDLGLFELLHMLSFSGKNAVITFPGMEGELVAAGGNILAVRQGSHQGKEALLRMFFMEKGSFCIVYEERKGETLGNIESLLLFIGSALDEIKDRINSLAPEGARLNLAEDSGQYPDIAQLRELFPITPADLALALPGDLEANADRVEEALQSGVLTIGEK